MKIFVFDDKNKLYEFFSGIDNYYIAIQKSENKVTDKISTTTGTRGTISKVS